MGFLYHPAGVVLQVLALVHAIKRRPDNYWYWVILIGGGIGALAYIAIEVLPDMKFMVHALSGAGRKNRIKQLQIEILDNPSPANFEELGELLWEQDRYTEARDAFDKAIAAKTDTLHAYYNRAQCSLKLGDAERALPDLEHVCAKDQDFDHHRAAALLGHTYGLLGKYESAEAWLKEATTHSNRPEFAFLYALLLKQQGRREEAAEWAQKVLNKKRTMPAHLQRYERPWFHRATALLKELSSK